MTALARVIDTAPSFFLMIPADMFYYFTRSTAYQDGELSMEKQQLVEKTTEILRPFETANLMTTMQTLTLTQISSPIRSC